jgi:hypothetical protein
MARSVALPAEKGSWSLVSEPILLGLLVAPSWGGAALAVGAFALFLCNRPLKVYLADRRRGRSYERTALALRYLVIYGVIALVGLAAGGALGGWRPFAPLIAAAPLLAVFMAYDQRPGRFWQAELIAPVAFAAIVAAMALADGWAWPTGAGAVGVYDRPRRARGAVHPRPAAAGQGQRGRAGGEPAGGVRRPRAGSLGSDGAGLGGLAALAGRGGRGRCCWPAPCGACRPGAGASSVIALGFLETGFGLLAVLLVAIGFWIE